MEEISQFKTIYTEEIYSVPSFVNIVTGSPWAEIKEEDRQLLANILHALKLSLESVRILCRPSFDLSLMAEKPERIIAFVAPPKGLACYEVIATGETSVVFSETLETLNKDEGAKRKLWNTLKVLFSS
jgi:DNA polymerase III psi subunit